MRRAAVLLLTLVTTLSCGRRGCRSVPPPAPTGRDDLRTAYVHFREEILAARDEPSRRALAEKIIAVSDVHDASFAKYGDVYHHYVQPEPSSTCLSAGTCFTGNLQFLRDAELAEFGSAPDIAARAERLARDLTLATIEKKLADHARWVSDRVVELEGLPRRGAPNAKRVAYVVSTGHPCEVRRDRSLARVLRDFPDFAVAEVRRSDHPAIVDALGRRLTAVAVFEGRVLFDVTEYEQWIELLDPGRAFPPFERRHDDVPLFDAHVHVGDGGVDRLRAFIVDEAIAGAVVAALADPNGSKIPAANARVLAAAATPGAPLLPFVTVDERAPDPLGELQGHLAAGARGLKLLTGHDDHHRARGRAVLDPPALRAVFRELEARRVPVLWHVNAHLYEAGLLRVLRDFPQLVVVNPHLGGYLGNAPGIVRELLSTYPNLYIDLSFGTQSRYLRRSIEELSARRDAWRALLIDFSDRFLFGVDMVVTPQTSRAHARMLYRLYTSMLADETFDLHYFAASGATQITDESHHHEAMTGLALPRDALQKIYFANAARVYGAK